MNDETFDLTELDHPDGAMLERLKASATLYGARVPDVVHQGALAAFSWRAMDEELAALLSDSADSDRLVGARATLSGMRLLEFVTSTGQISIGLSDASLMTGTLTGYASQTAQLVSASGESVNLIVDEFGDFLCDEIPTGPVRLELGGGAGRVVTDWILPPVA